VDSRWPIWGAWARARRAVEPHLGAIAAYLRSPDGARYRPLMPLLQCGESAPLVADASAQISQDRVHLEQLVTSGGSWKTVCFADVGERGAQVPVMLAAVHQLTHWLRARDDPGSNLKMDRVSQTLADTVLQAIPLPGLLLFHFDNSPFFSLLEQGSLRPWVRLRAPGLDPVVQQYLWLRVSPGHDMLSDRVRTLRSPACSEVQLEGDVGWRIWEFLRWVLSDGPVTVVEVGAHHGDCGLVLAGALQGEPGSRIVLYEPGVLALDRMRRSVQANSMKHVELRGVAVGDVVGASKSFGFAGSPLLRVGEKDPLNSTTEQGSVVTLTTLSADLNFAVTLLILHVPYPQMDIFWGARAFLTDPSRGARLLVIRMHKEELEWWEEQIAGLGVGYSFSVVGAGVQIIVVCERPWPAQECSSLSGEEGCVKTLAKTADGDSIL